MIRTYIGDMPQRSTTMFKKGLKRTSFFYSVSFMAIVIFHLIIGWHYVYAPPLSLILINVLLLVGLFWTLLNLIALFRGTTRSFALGELTVHAFVLTSLLLFALASSRMF
jgi:hypothetical protein